MFYYAEDKIFSEVLIPDKVVSGVVGYVDKAGEHGLVVLKHQKRLLWSNVFLCVGVPRRWSGKVNTSLILNEAREQRVSAEAAEYCVEYAHDGVKVGEAFLPSEEELQNLYTNKPLINGKLALIGNVDLIEAYHYWSSSENSNKSAWLLNFHNGRTLEYYKFYSYSVLPVIEF